MHAGQEFRTVEDHIAHVVAECCDYGMEEDDEGAEQEEADAEKDGARSRYELLLLLMPSVRRQQRMATLSL